MRVAKIPIADARWRDFVCSHPAAGPFHLPEWAEVVADCYRFDAFALVVLDNEGGIAGGTPVVEVRLPFRARRWVSLPFTDSCPLLVQPGVDPEAVAAALTAHVLGGGVSGLEVRGALPLADHRYATVVGYGHRLDLPAEPADLQPRKSYRNIRNRARRSGVRIVRGTATKDVDTYYELHTATRRRLGVPVQPRRFFDLIGDRLVARGHGFVATALLDNQPLAACLYLGHNGVLVAKFGASAAGRSDTGAGHLLDWEIMSAACHEGYHTLDFGRTDLDADGLRLYKTGWGAVEEPLIYTYVADRAPAQSRPSVGGLSRRLVRNSPTWVARGVGELLYRWTA